MWYFSFCLLFFVGLIAFIWLNRGTKYQREINKISIHTYNLVFVTGCGFACTVLTIAYLLLPR